MKKHLKERIHEIIFEADTPWGRAFDVTLLAAIVLSMFAVMLESVKQINQDYEKLLYIIEWVFTGLFTIEYIARIIVIKRPWKYVFSFFGLVDLLSIIPTYLSLIFVGAHSFLVIRSIRLLRIFRIFKLAQYLGEASQLVKALKASRIKMIVFIGTILTVVIILGTLMYLIEGSENGFTSIPTSIYWAIVTLTTVGYGDIAPNTSLGKMVASVVMILGYGIIAVPTGIVTAELSKQKTRINTTSCQNCGQEGHDDDAEHCKYCGELL